jgi:hypothetical protein
MIPVLFHFPFHAGTDDQYRDQQQHPCPIFMPNSQDTQPVYADKVNKVKLAGE